MRIFVTGGSGFVGQYLIPHLTQQGHQVVALARSEATAKRVEALGACAVRGDLTDATALSWMMTGCHAVVHLAAAFEMWGTEQFFFETNVLGTDHLLAAARQAQVSRFVYISAASVIAGGYPASQVDERYRPPQLPDDLYSKTKLIAEQHVLEANAPELLTLSLRPPLIWGSGHPMTEQIHEAVQKRRWVWIGGGRHRLSTIHVKNLCDAISAALVNGQGGEIYHVTDGEIWSLRPFLTRWLRNEGIETPGTSVPRGFALALARLVTDAWRMLGLKSTPPLTPGMVYMLGTELTLNDQKAHDQLGYRPGLSIEQGLAMGLQRDLG